MDIIIPILIAVCIGAALAVMLGIASKLFHVKTDEKISEILSCLPMANCGACGFASCEDYAGKIAAGEAPPNLCLAGGKQMLNALCDVLGITAEPEMEVNKAIVACAGYHGVTEDKLEYNGVETCAAANMYFKGKGRCDYGCLGFGDCIKACKFGAIRIKKGVAVVDRKKCTGCKMCVEACPKEIIKLAPENLTTFVACSSQARGIVTKNACQRGCIACTKCVKACKYDAIYMDGFLAKIRYENCVDCGECRKVCPTGAILDSALLGKGK